MRTLIVSRRQQGPVQVPTLPDPVSEIVQEETHFAEEKTYVAVGKDLCESVNALKWALRNLSNREAALVILLHIQLPLRYMPSPMGKIPLNRVCKDVLKAYNKDVEEELNNCMKKYLDICTRAKVKAEVSVIEKDDVSKGIVEVVSEQGITKLIMGTTSAGGAISKKMKMQAPGKADYVQRHTIESCEVSIVCKEKLVLCMEGSPVHKASQKSKSFKSPLSGWPRKRPEPSTPKPFRSVSSPSITGGHLDFCNQFPLNYSVTGDCTSAWPEEVDDSERAAATIDELPSESVVADSTQLDLDDDYTHNNVEAEAQGSQVFPPDEALGACTDIETLKLQLLEVAENAQREVQDEIAKRKKAEAAAVKANFNFRDLEAVFKETVEEKEKATSLLRVTEEKLQEISRRKNEVEEKLQAMVETVNRFSRERHEAIQEIEAARQKIAAMEEQNHRILKQKEAEIKQLQDCLHSKSRVETTSSSVDNLQFREYSLDDIKAATCNFSENFKLGEGGYGTVFKGKIGQTTVALKILREDSLQGRREFQREIDILKDIRHPHLVRAVGTCFERGCILYEYMSNGCLADRLSCKNATPPLTWQDRIRIAAEVCSALQFLHSYKPDPIVHPDFKLESILLDESFVSKISDLGLARLLQQDLNTESQPTETFSYMDPEYLTSSEYSTKSDVYSLGIVILQLLTGKPALGLAKEVESALKSANLNQVLDSSAGEWPFVHATQLAELALYCTKLPREKRPDLQPTVMKMLDQLRNFAVAASNRGRPIECGKKLAQAADEIHIPNFFLCPVFKEVMQDPCVAADGHTYEMEAIRGWIDCGRDSSPMTNKKLGHTNLIPNFSLRSAIRHWQETGEL